MIAKQEWTQINAQQNIYLMNLLTHTVNNLLQNPNYVNNLIFLLFNINSI